MNAHPASKLSAVPLRFATFWAGSRMPALDQACLKSFVHGGHDLVVYSFEVVDGLPLGVSAADARDIVNADDLSAFIYAGKPNTSHFTDYFRYQLFAKTNRAWVDTDVFLLQPIQLQTEMLLAKETSNSICGAVMRIPSTAPALQQLIQRTERLKGQNLVWGATGPRLISHVMGKKTVLNAAFAATKFFPVHYDEFWKPLLPEFKDECVNLCRNASTIHLWNNILVQLGLWKEIAPPQGSFLGDLISNSDCLKLFKDVYPVDVMRQMVINWHFRKSGGDIGVRQITQQFIPSFGRTFGPRLRAIRQIRA